MSNTESKRRIKFAYYLDGWSYENGDHSFLRNEASRVIPSDYDSAMDGALFCPGCFTNLNRIPKDKNWCSNGRPAYFSHIRTYKDIHCDLKSIKPEGKRYDTYEDAKKAIDDESLVIISSLLKDKPEFNKGNQSEYNQTPIEDMAGPLATVPIGRHDGESFKLPSRVKTINGICRNFDENLYKYYIFPGQSSAIRLLDLLNNIENINEKTEKKRLYYGQITHSVHLGEHKQMHNMRMTYLKNSQSGVADFCLKLTHQKQDAHGIGDDSAGRYVIVYGEVVSNGVGLCFEGLGWGEFTLLPNKYIDLLPHRRN